ncbi:hypothetical protein HK105_204657 [Polyrhizophydium stewartii]|uniref:Uncharacterized protein n=1 Tax=Polyrhizophydium stewartii TaxID=2732419 RepID=A0ABR4N864_9FUNG|nr:hypothetical protein HK105_007815 [Polyrhizophydium stewartii]
MSVPPRPDAPRAKGSRADRPAHGDLTEGSTTAMNCNEPEAEQTRAKEAINDAHLSTDWISKTTEDHATASEVAVKADRTDTPPIEQLQQETVVVIKVLDDTISQHRQGSG